MNNMRDPSRLRLGLNPILTSPHGPGYPQNTPLSAASLTSNAQYAPQTPASAIQPYNPQEWLPSPMASAERPRGYGHEQQQQQQQQQQPASPLPPPPYSPPRSQRPVSQSFDTVVANTSATRVPPSNISAHRPSPDAPVNTSFPPPPGSSSRGPSRERRFGLPSLTRRRDHDQNQSQAHHSPEPSFTHNTSRNLSIHIPQAEVQRYTAAYHGTAPPNARRAVSVGAIETPTSARSRSSSQVRWEPGMPLPPPPPGPPPSQSRSQSLQPSDRLGQPVASPPTRRPPPTGVTALGPVPPTPANWVDEDAQPGQAQRGRSPGLTIETAGVPGSSQQEDLRAPNSAGLTRAKAVRHEKSIIQRRAESKTRGETNPNELADIVVPNGTTLSGRLTINKSTPRSAGGPNLESGETPSHASRNVTPRALGAPHLSHADTSTQPFSHQAASHATSAAEGPDLSISKALLTPPPRVGSAASDDVIATPASSMRPPRSGASLPPSRQSVVMQSSEEFNRDTVDRFKLFASREAAAETDADRVRMFADFIVSESRIRRERYGGAIAAMGSEIFDLTRDLFRPMESRRESGTSWGAGEWTPQSSGHVNSAPPSANFPESPAAAGTPTNPNWGNNNFMPSLSPILSMSNVDGTDSRGRPASRWWETDSNGAPGQGLERSKRESKYMGVPKEAREALQWIESPKRTESYGTNDYDSPSDYPSDKKGTPLSDQEPVLTPHAQRHSLLSAATSSQPSTPNPSYLDISRLVTLPPPYPRHHPAVNNNHPDLAEIRAAVRTLSGLDEVAAAKEKFQNESDRRREELKKQSAERRHALRLSLQDEINSGRLSYAEAAEIDGDATKAENDKVKGLEKTDFEQFQKHVVGLTNDLLTNRIEHATRLLDDLAGRLFDDVGNTADMPQEEGDDKPELLEKLTLLKWIFEAREALHKTIFDLLSDRNDRYKAVITTPYRLSGNEEKLQQAEAFFQEDIARRTHVFSTEVHERTEAFEKVISDNVSRGVEAQLSAFWDIAPNISGLLDRLPSNLLGFRVRIPPEEFEENPAYREHPLQYLFSLLLHTEKSTYQFIESQTNLLCLLHEVREAVANARARVIETEVDESGAPGTNRERRAEGAKAEDTRRLTDDLKEKVRVVQDQWNEALGEAIRNVKERVGGWLLETGGWDEQLEDGGVGVS